MKNWMYILTLLFGVSIIGCDRADEPDTETVIIKEEPAPEAEERGTRVDVKVDRDEGVEFELEKDE